MNRQDIINWVNELQEQGYDEYEIEHILNSCCEDCADQEEYDYERE